MLEKVPPLAFSQVQTPGGAYSAVPVIAGSLRLRSRGRGITRREQRTLGFEAHDLSEQVGAPLVIQPAAWDRLLKAGQSLNDVGAKEVMVAIGQRCSQIVHRRVPPSMVQTG